MVSASDPDDEVRAAVRLVMAALVDGVPLERMAILYGATEPYARLVHEQLEAAGIPHNGAAVRTLAESVLGRSLLGLLALPDRDFHRHDVMALLAGAPVWYPRACGAVGALGAHQPARGRGARGHAMARATRASRPARWKRSWPRSSRCPTASRVPTGTSTSSTRSATLDAFVAELRDALAAGAQPGVSWRDLSAWARRLVREFLAHDLRRGAWPEAEQQAADKVEAALERLAGLDAVEPAPGLDVFRRTLELELDADLGRVGRLGEGILMGHVALGLGLDLDRVFVCGLAEGTFPARVRDDSLLPDADRRATDGALPLRASRVDDDHRRLLAALAAARDARVLLYPRGDLRRTTDRMPSRFLLDTVEALTGSRLLRRRPAPARRRLVPADPVVRGGRRARGVPGDRTGTPAPRAARPHPERRRHRHVDAPRRRRRARARASTARSPARAPRSRASTATSAASRCRAPPVPTRSCPPPASNAGPSRPSTT